MSSCPLSTHTDIWREITIFDLVLASSSIYRQELLSRLELPFRVVIPDIDESPVNAESPHEQVQRLALQKAEKVAQIEPEALVIGSDQLAVCGQATFGKPMTKERAVQQLQSMRKNTLLFHTGLCLLNASSGKHQLACVEFSVHFRDYSDEEIHRYIDKEKPFNCAGSFKSEKLGITLVESMEGSDPSALIGLPLLKLCQMLRHEGLILP